MKTQNWNIIRAEDYHELHPVLLKDEWKTEELDPDTLNIEFDGFYYGLIYVGERPTNEEVVEVIRNS